MHHSYFVTRLALAVFCVTATATFVCPSAQAQAISGDLVGTITDTSGAVIPTRP